MSAAIGAGASRVGCPARGQAGPTVASSSTAGDVVDIDLASLAAPGETIRFVLEATDNAGLSREVISAQVTRPTTTTGGAPGTTIVGGDGPFGEPGRIEARGAALPNFSRVETRGLRAHQARSYSRNGRLLVPFIAATYSRPMRIAGRFFHANRRGLRGATVYLVDPRGFSQATTVTDRRGRFRFRVRPRLSGTWRAIALGRPLVVAPALVQLRLRVTTRVVPHRIPPEAPSGSAARSRLVAPGEASSSSSSGVRAEPGDPSHSAPRAEAGASSCDIGSVTLGAASRCPCASLFPAREAGGGCRRSPRGSTSAWAERPALQSRRRQVSAAGRRPRPPLARARPSQPAARHAGGWPRLCLARAWWRPARPRQPRNAASAAWRTWSYGEDAGARRPQINLC